MNSPFTYTRSARPTTYNSINFRSELEAAWAAFFDIRGIQYEYEPLLDLKFWRPDFSVKVKGSEKDIILVEVKPYHSINLWRNDKETLSKIKKCFAAEFITVLLGASPLLQANVKFGVQPNVVITDEDVLFEPFSFGDDEVVGEEWNRAKNTVRWKQ